MLAELSEDLGEAMVGINEQEIEHIQILSSLGVGCVELRQAAGLEQPLAGLVLPGGESTV